MDSEPSMCSTDYLVICGRASARSMYPASATLESPLDSSKHIIAQLLCGMRRSLMEWNVATIEPDRIKTSYQYDGAPAGSRQSTQITSVRAQRLHWIRRSGSKCRENTGGRGASPERKN